MVKYLPQDDFNLILEHMPIPTFNLVIQYGKSGVILVQRKISPYKNKWALPGLRMHKGEDINDVIKRIGIDELGLELIVYDKHLVAQNIAKFTSNHHRQDIATCYSLCTHSVDIKINEKHFLKYRFIKSIFDVPRNTGKSYYTFLQEYFNR